MHSVKLELIKDVSLPDNILVGKDVLELVSGAMYVDPLDIFREYVQNATDSIDQSEQNSQAQIDIILDPNSRSITVRDNGAGLSNNDFASTMTAIGGSRKRSIPGSRGFRGVGRLAGLGYCRSLSFRSKGSGDQYIQELTWDCVKFKKILRDSSFQGNLEDVIKEVVSISSTLDKDKYSFFEVSLNGVVRLKNDILLNGERVKHYLSQVAPVPFRPEFSHRRELESRLNKFGIGAGYAITLLDTSFIQAVPEIIYRPHRDEFSGAGSQVDRIGALQHLELPGVNGELAAIGWIADTGYFGAIPPSELLCGIRFRVGNIQVGGSDIVANQFPESRFNSWSIGELHVLTNKIVPNGRRDNFEENTHFENLLTQLQPYLRKIAHVCRSKSSVRQWTARFDAKVSAVNQDLTLLEKGSLSKRKTPAQIKVVQSTIMELDDLIVNSKYDWVEHLNGRVEHLKSRLDKISKRNSIEEHDPLASVPYQKRLAFQEVLELVYEVSANKEVGNMMIEKVIKRLASKYG